MATDTEADDVKLAVFLAEVFSWLPSSSPPPAEDEAIVSSAPIFVLCGNEADSFFYRLDSDRAPVRRLRYAVRPNEHSSVILVDRGFCHRMLPETPESRPCPVVLALPFGEPSDLVTLFPGRSVIHATFVLHDSEGSDSARRVTWKRSLVHSWADLVPPLPSPGKDGAPRLGPPLEEETLWSREQWSAMARATLGRLHPRYAPLARALDCVLPRQLVQHIVWAYTDHVWVEQVYERNAARLGLPSFWPATISPLPKRKVAAAAAGVSSADVDDDRRVKMARAESHLFV